MLKLVQCHRLVAASGIVFELLPALVHGRELIIQFGKLLIDLLDRFGCLFKKFRRAHLGVQRSLCALGQRDAFREGTPVPSAL